MRLLCSTSINTAFGPSCWWKVFQQVSHALFVCRRCRSKAQKAPFRQPPHVAEQLELCQVLVVQQFELTLSSVWPKVLLCFFNASNFFSQVSNEDETVQQLHDQSRSEHGHNFLRSASILASSASGSAFFNRRTHVVASERFRRALCWKVRRVVSADNFDPIISSAWISAMVNLNTSFNELSDGQKFVFFKSPFESPSTVWSLKVIGCVLPLSSLACWFHGENLSIIIVRNDTTHGHNVCF